MKFLTTPAAFLALSGPALAHGDSATHIHPHGVLPVMTFDIFLALAALSVTIGCIAFAWRQDPRTGDWTWANLKARLARIVPKP